MTDPYPGHGKYRGMLAIPYLDRNGQPVAMRFRCLQEHNHRDFDHGKYNSIKDDPARLYNIRAIHEADDEIHLTEGEFDAKVLEMVGFDAVAAPGAQSWKPRHRRMLAGFNRVWIWGDPDDAGAELVTKVMRSLRRARPVRLSVGDVSETYMAGGAAALRAAYNKEVASL